MKLPTDTQKTRAPGNIQWDLEGPFLRKAVWVSRTDVGLAHDAPCWKLPAAAKEKSYLRRKSNCLLSS